MSFNLEAEEKKDLLRVAAFKIPGVIEKDGSGKYNEILKRVSILTNVDFEVSVLPIARARASYAKGLFDCLLPQDSKFEGNFLNHIHFTPFNTAKLFAFTDKGTPPITTIKGLEGLRVGGEIGMPYPDELNEIIGKNKVARLHSLVKMLQKGRIDAFLAYTPDITKLFEDEGIDPLTYDPQAPLTFYRDTMTCRPTKRNYELVNEINFAIKNILHHVF